MGNYPPKIALANGLRLGKEDKVAQLLSLDPSCHQTFSDLSKEARKLIALPSEPLAPANSRRYGEWSKTTLLHCACEGASGLVVPLLLAGGGDLCARNGTNDTALHAICRAQGDGPGGGGGILGGGGVVGGALQMVRRRAGSASARKRSGSTGGKASGAKAAGAAVVAAAMMAERLSILRQLLVACELKGPAARERLLGMLNDDGDVRLLPLYTLRTPTFACCVP
jgi:hypothetical protein